jgi:FG-GAP-like repeat
MTARILWTFALAALVISIYSCQSKESKAERMSKHYCSTCHQFPEPNLLDKKTWERFVLPEMAFRMGLDNSRLMSGVNVDDLPSIMMVVPQEPIMSTDEWLEIKKYYLENAPDSLPLPEKAPAQNLTQFTGTQVRLGRNFPMVTLVQQDTLNGKIFVGTRDSRLYRLNNQLVKEDSFLLPSPPSRVSFQKDKNVLVTAMGIMDPNDQTKGQLLNLNADQHTTTTILDSLRRPVYFEVADLNGDHLEDYVVCAFGNYTGALLAYENLGTGKFKRHVVNGLPGSRKVVVRDFNGDGLKDILALTAQGDERIVLFRNKGDFQFTDEVLLRFPPVYGSSYFDLADFNHDGQIDILYTNGDNSDYSSILKPYHGVRIFLNDGHFKFTQSWFYPMNGASQALARDFDGDGDIDVAAISFFPDFDHTPEEGFIYFENTEKDFKAFTTPLAKSGRWLVMEACDIDHNGSMDLILGSLAFRTRNRKIFEGWMIDKTSLLLLSNNLKAVSVPATKTSRP